MAKKRNITAKDLYKFELMSGVRISPDGKNVLYSSQRVDSTSEKKYSNLFLISTDKGAATQFTRGDQNDTHPRWSPGGEEIAFLSNRSDTDLPPQIFTIPLRGGEARQITDIKGQISDFSWSPDGKKLLCSIVKFDEEFIERQKDEKKKELGVVVREYDRLFYKLDGFGFLPKERKHIWVVTVQTGKAKQITDHEVYDEFDPSWSPDGKRIVFLSNRSKEPDNSPFEVDLFTISGDGGELSKIETPLGDKSKPVFSPDNKWIAYHGAENQGKMYKNTSLYIVPADRSEPVRNLTEKYDFEVGGGVINDMGHGETMPPVWSNDCKFIYFQTSFHGSTLLKRINIEDESVEKIFDEGGEIGSFSFDKIQSVMAYFYGKIDDTGQVYTLDMISKKVRKLTKHNESIFRSIKLGEVEEVWYKGSDGNDLQGWILKPPGFDPGKRYPSILEIHGGPWAQYGNFFMHEFYYLAANGYVVHYTNPRGGRGYGEQHAKAISQNWGGPDYKDLMVWTDLMADKPYIDPERMGVTGGSYGMTTWIIGHTDRFKAAVAQRCVSNLVSMWGSSDFNWIFQQEFGDVAPFEDFEQLWDHSPMKYMGNVKTPTMLIHSEMDLRCAIEQSEQVFVALKRLGVDTKLIRFPDEPHGLSRNGRTDRRIVRLLSILSWFDKYLKK
jgi:dipeptidyl aminopeptidase/acylaminoacyl peptidase